MNLNSILTSAFSVNYRTTILGIGVIVAAVGRIALAFRSKRYDFLALAEDGQLIAATIATLAAGLGLFIAKDANVTGAGSQAKSVDSAGIVTNAVGTEIGKQPSAPSSPR